MYSSYGLTFNEKYSRSFSDGFGRNVMIFGVDNSSVSHTDLKHDPLILSEGSTFGINGSFDAPVKKICINFSKPKTKFCLSLHYNAGNSYLFVNGKEIYKFKFSNKISNFPCRFSL